MRHQQPVTPRRLNPKIPRDLETITLKCLDKNSSRRFASANALGEDLSRWLDNRPIQARPSTLFERGWRWCRRQRAIASLTTILAATVLGGFVWLLALYKRADYQRVRAEDQTVRAEDQRAQADAARSAAEGNLRVATALTVRLRALVLAGSHSPELYTNAQIAITADLLKGQISTIKGLRNVSPDPFYCLGTVEYVVYRRLTAMGRFDVARVLVRDWIDLLRACRERNPENASYKLHLTDALRL